MIHGGTGRRGSQFGCVDGWRREVRVSMRVGWLGDEPVAEGQWRSGNAGADVVDLHAMLLLRVLKQGPC